MNKIFRTAIFGFGKIAYGYGDDKKYIKEYPIPTHFEAIKKIQNLDLDTVIDADENALKNANEAGVKNLFNDIRDVNDIDQIEFLTLSCPPHINKLNVIKAFPSLKGLVLEKPVTDNVCDSKEILEYIRKANIKTQVCYLRRFDDFAVSLQSGGLNKLIGKPQMAQIVYGNGLRNNGSHMLDLCMMLLGDFTKNIRSLNTNIDTCVLDNDLNITCLLKTKSGINISMTPIDFKNYRENSLDIWGKKGRIVINQEGSYFSHWKSTSSRFGDIYKEINWSEPYYSGKTKIGNAIEKLYLNLIESIKNNKNPISSLDSSIKTEELINKIILDYDKN